jgi:hypothetical protein
VDSPDPALGFWVEIDPGREAVLKKDAIPVFAFSEPSYVRKLTRREALSRIVAASSLLSTVSLNSFASQILREVASADQNASEKIISWPRLLDAQEMAFVVKLANTLIPEDQFGPHASAVGVPDFINEWVSAPLPMQQEDLKTLRQGIQSFDQISQTTFSNTFVNLESQQVNDTLNLIISEKKGAQKSNYKFFTFIRELVSVGYFTTPVGWKAIGYVGNEPMESFPGAPEALLKKFGF